MSETEAAGVKVILDDPDITTWVCGRFRATAYRHAPGVWRWACWWNWGDGIVRVGGFAISREEARQRALATLAGKAAGASGADHGGTDHAR